MWLASLTMCVSFFDWQDIQSRGITAEPKLLHLCHLNIPIWIPSVAFYLDYNILFCRKSYCIAWSSITYIQTISHLIVKMYKNTVWEEILEKGMTCLKYKSFAAGASLEPDQVVHLLLLLYKSVQLCANSVRPRRRQPTRLTRPWDSPGKNTGVGCHFLLQCIKVKSESEVAQLCLTLSDPMDCSLPGSSAHGIFQARVLEWSAIAFSRLYT